MALFGGGSDRLARVIGLGSEFSLEISILFSTIFVILMCIVSGLALAVVLTIAGIGIADATHVYTNCHYDYQCGEICHYSWERDRDARGLLSNNNEMVRADN